MDKDQFRDVFKRIEATWERNYTDLQFEEWWDSFKDEDYGVVRRAFRIMKDEYGYPPIPATFRAYIHKAKDIQTAEEETRMEKKVYQPTPKDRDRGKRWARYFMWIVESKEYPKTKDEAMELKAKFEKEHPN